MENPPPHLPSILLDKMDASEDRDLKLQRASADLLAEFGSSLTKFLWKSPPEGDQQGKPVLKVRSYVKECKTNSLIKLVGWISDLINIHDKVVMVVSFLAGAFSGMATTARFTSCKISSSSNFCLHPISMQSPRYLLCTPSKRFYCHHTFIQRHL